MKRTQLRLLTSRSLERRELRPASVNASNTAGGVCVPQAIGSGGRAANCATSTQEAALYPVGTPGVLVLNNIAEILTNAATLTIGALARFARNKRTHALCRPGAASLP